MLLVLGCLIYSFGGWLVKEIIVDFTGHKTNGRNWRYGEFSDNC